MDAPGREDRHASDSPARRGPTSDRVTAVEYVVERGVLGALEQGGERRLRAERRGDPQDVLERRIPDLLEAMDRRDAKARAVRQLLLAQRERQAQLLGPLPDGLQGGLVGPRVINHRTNVIPGICRQQIKYD